MNGKDKISVIIPCYNVQKYIMRCFDSIYSQTYGFENLEVILIDDLSTDNTWSILESLQRQYPENVISLKIQKKGKCGGARNLGMDICTGKYITFVDADDYVHPDMLRVLYDRMTEDDYDVVQCGVSCFKADKPNVLEVNDFEIQRLDLDNVDNRKNLIIGLTGFTNVTAWAKLYSTKFIIEHNLRFTFQNLFMMFDKMAGMSGTLMDAKDELFETYGKQVVKIPTNRPLKRVDRKDRYFKNGHDQFWTAVDDVIRLHETGQPVLVVLNSVTDTDLFSRLLIEKNIPHNVLNASNAFWEAQIIAGAGQMNAVTVATTMAGRGTDIKLGDGVKELGGLAVIGIGRMNNSRSERQARGRAGRQGDPGFSQYYVSLEDDIVGAEDDDKLQRYIDGKKRIGKRKIKRIVNQCQKLSVESEEMNRKKSLQYDQVLQRQRDLIYATRKKLLDGASVGQEKIVEIAKGNISDFVNHFDCIQSNNKHGRRRGRKKDNDKNTNTEQYTSMLNRYILDNISYKLDTGLSRSDMESAATVSDYLMLRVYQGLSRQREHIGDEEAYEQFVREATLKAVDDGWVELIDYLEQLKYAVAGRASAQRNVMFEYQNEAFESFLDTEKAVKCNIIRNILLSDVKIGKDGRLHVIYP